MSCLAFEINVVGLLLAFAFSNTSVEVIVTEGKWGREKLGTESVFVCILQYKFHV